MSSKHRRYLARHADDSIRLKKRRLDDEIPKPIGISAVGGADVSIINCQFNGIPSPVVLGNNRKVTLRNNRASF